MLAALLTLFVATPIPSGAYAMPELCRQLTTATGVAHMMDVNVRDYPVYVSVKSGDPARVEKLVATAMHAEWRDDGTGRLRLTQTKPIYNEDLAHFEAAFKKAAASSKTLLALPIQDVYRMAPGEIIRYGTKPNAYIKKWPTGAPKGNTTEAGFAVRRMAWGVFETSGAQEANFSLLPDEAVQFLGADLSKSVITDEMKAEIKKKQGDPQALKVDFADLEKRDPAAILADELLPTVSKAVSKDFVVALPDFSFFALFAAGDGNGTVRSILEGYSMAVDWVVSDDALIGRLPNIELTAPAQSRRPVLAKFLQGIEQSGVANVGVLSDYVKNQRSNASNSWTDAMMLVLDGIVVDEEYIGEYPFNIRLYTQLSSNDWALLKSGQPFSASLLSIPSQKMLRDVLLQSRDCISNEKPDPGFWPSIAPADLTIEGAISEEPVLVGYTGVGPEVYNVDNAAANHDMRTKSLGREPLYQPGIRRKLQMTISVAKQEEPMNPFVTGFSEVFPDSKVKKCKWNELPTYIMEPFKEALARSRGIDTGQGGTPPPTARRAP